MNNVKLTIVYYSMTGKNFQLANWAKEAAEDSGAEVRLVKVKELAPEEAIETNPVWKAQVEREKDIKEATSEDLTWADAIIFSSPTRFGNVASQIKQFMDMQGGIWAEGKLVDKVVSAMSSAQNPHGGQEETIRAIYTTMMHWGAIIVPPGYTDDSIYKAGGNPYGTSVTVGKDGMIEDVETAVKHQANRTVEVAKWIKRGKENDIK
ncbi:NAD(P)H:quinone oxidoreductase [Tissierella creatinophila]|uniref:NAD(P)H dehydrogenase (Quinone) n=1 Tax=Tissierella creatinophila DSM 6911 TaxID=1123403 RepID=A0A1U7M560_TISCR|nr:NAD(P)H:quinone oxidoreductase [Tissierella creatinophila]OLS02328.1 NAD(P)H dehydrogenase (quinone) [Tissierella creatinophila DSM 6911]